MHGTLDRCIQIGILLFSFFQTNSFAGTTTTELMVTAGDSISAGFLSNWRAQRKSEDEDVKDDLPHPPHSIPEWKIRIGQALNHKYTLSWSSGFNVNSHYLRLYDYLEKHEPNVFLRIQNVALSGAVVADLDAQANQVLNAWKTGRYQNVRYITLTIGANDACAPWFEGGNPDSEIEAGIRSFFKKLSVIQQPKPIRVLVASIPKIPDLGVPEILNHWLTRRMTCEYRMRYKDKYCESLIFWKTPQEYEKRVEIVRHKNEVIRNLIQKLGQEFPQFEFAFGESLFKQKIELSFLSKDCFHPNWDGQEQISEHLWNDQPWFK